MGTKRGWESKAEGKRQNRSERDAWYPPMALDCKTLQLPPPPLAVFFLIASWAIFGDHLKWELWGEGTEGVEEERFCAYACVSVCVGEGWAFGPAEAMNKHSDRQQGRGCLCVHVCVVLCCYWRQEKKHTCKITQTHAQAHSQTQMWNH